jgi:Fe-S oxidoreductase/nitrate reductase gamma subunit
MELTRELYWNVGHGAATLLPMYLAVLIALGVMVKHFLLKIEIYKQGLPLERTDRLDDRALRALRDIFWQRRVIRKRWPGLVHGLFFWGFSVLTLGTILVFIQADVTDPLLDRKFLTGFFYLFFSLSLDIAGLLCLGMLAGLLVHRYNSSADVVITRLDTTMYAVLAAILATGFVVEGARMAVTELGTQLSYWSPVGLLFAVSLSWISQEGLRGLHSVMWWIHLALVIGFIVLIPFTRLKHIVTTSLNYLFESLEPKGKLAKLDLENEDAETFGATNLQELTWKDIFDSDACTTCKRCQERCPAFSTGKPLSPMKVVTTIGKIATTDPQANLLEAVGEDAIWSCTTCGACQNGCPAAVEHIGKIVEFRRAMVLTHATFPSELMDTFNNLENQSNPWGFNEDTRADWCKDLPVPRIAEKEAVDILWFVGCAGSFDDKAIKTSRAIASILIKAGVNFAILGREERCNGDMARRCGNEYLAQMMIAENVETMGRYTFKRILTGCPHCYNTIKNEYPEFGADYDVVSHVDYIWELIESGALKIKGDLTDTITFHDSCYFGRWNDIYESPRRILIAMHRHGGMVEVVDNRENAICCGGGGGRMFLEETQGERINEVRCRQILDTGAATVAVACPFCLTMLKDGMNSLKGNTGVSDIAQLVDSVT